MRKRIISFITALSITLMMFAGMPINVAEAAITATRTVDGIDYVYDPNSGSNDNYFRKDEYEAASTRTIDTNAITYEVGYGEVKVTWSLDSQDIELIDNISIELVDNFSGLVLASGRLEKNINEGIFSGIDTSVSVRLRIAPTTFIDRYEYNPADPDDPNSEESVVLAQKDGFAVNGVYIIKDIGRLDNCTHELVFHAAVDAACTAAGNSEYWTCSRCDKIFSDENGTDEIYAIPTIPALGHSYVGVTCTVCGEIDPDADIAINETNFPDANFRQYVYDHYNPGFDGTLYSTERASVKEINVSGMNISNMKGIEYFTKLEHLNCSGNQLTALDVSNNPNLETLYCYDNQLTSLDISNNTALIEFDCVNNQYTVSDCMIDPADLPGSFDLSKASDWTNARITADGKIISDGTGTATYTYDCGNGKSKKFTIQFGAHNYVNGECTRCHVTVNNAPKITLNQQETAVLDTSPTSITCTATVENLDNPVITFACEPEDIVVITQAGASAVIQGAKAGEGTVTVTATDGTNTVSAELGVIVECAHETGITYVKDEDDPSSGHWKNCSICGKVGKEPEEHSMDADRSTARPATCTENGKYYDMVCAECGYRESGAVIPAKGHSFTNYVSNNDATCTADGTKTAKCDRCDETETIADVSSALGHSCVEHAAVPATCTADGNEAYWTCSGCDKMFADEDGTDEITAILTVPALGHSYVNGVCERCGEHENVPSPSYTLTPATATIKTGLSNGQVFTLEGYTAIEQIDWDIDPAYAAKYVGSQFGLEHNQCKIVGTAAGGPVTLTAKSLGGDVLGTATITFTDGTVSDHTHTPAEAWTSDATGHWHACSGCTEKVDFAAHTFDGGEETLPPTADNEGIMTYTCEICQYKETRSIPKLDPSPDTSGDKPEPPVTTSYVGGFSTPPAAETSDTPQTAEPPVSSPEEITDAPSTSPETAVQPPLSETTALPEQSGESSSAPDVINVGNISKDEISGENAPKARLSDTAAELAEKVLGSKDIELINGGANMTIMLSVSNISDYISKEDKNSIEAALDTLPDYRLGQYLDISLIKTVNGEREIITEAKAPLTVTVDIPEAIRGADREYKIIRVHGGETVILDDIDGDPDTVTVKTDRFSSYAIVYRDKETKPGGTENNQNTGVESNTVFFAAAGITALSLLVLLHFTTGRNGISEAKKERLFRKLIAWGKKGGKLRSLTALALIWILLAFYYSIGMKTPQ